MSYTYKDNTDEVISALEKSIENGLTAIGMTAEGHAKRKITDYPAVDTGRLRNSISNAVDKKEKAVYIGTNVEYAPYVELGTGIYASDGNGRQDPWVYQDEDGKWHFTRGMKPRPFLKPAATEHSAEYKAIMEEKMKNAK